jgi:Zn-dependent M28 family amino/carboxypeptidase
VLFSGHQDHDGIKAPVAGDSIWNGADDNGSVSVGILAIGRAWARNPARRPALFVWHGAEEKGLLGSRYFVKNPIVPLNQIVAVLNADMIGQNNPDSAAILGAQPPHMNSRELADMGLRANDMVTKFALDSLWDRPTHPEGWYFRSDHVPYAQAGVPSLYFSSLPHPLYHTPKDDPDHINYAKLTKMAQWMSATGWLVANAPERVKLLPKP